jgi:hypothetical protein
VHGYGVYYWPDGVKYEGELKNGLRDGKGVWYKSNGTIKYDGEWQKNKQCGYGVFYYYDSCKKYEG